MKQSRIAGAAALTLACVFAHACSGGAGIPSGYTVGGVVTGLGGTLVLQLNGDDDLTIITDGSFVFSRRLDDGAPYEVTVLGQPDEHRIEIAGGAGTIAGISISNVRVTCCKWTHPADITDFISPPGGDCRDARVAIDDQGNAIIAWTQFDGFHDQVFMSELRAGSWAHPSSLLEHISVGGTAIHSGPAVAMDSAGDALITWTQSDGSSFQVFMSEYRSGSWSHPSSLADHISVAGSSALAPPAVAMSDNGEALIAWTQSDGTDHQIFVSEYRSGSWTHPADLTDHLSVSGSGNFTGWPDVAMDGAGDAVIAWAQFDGSSLWQVFKSEYRSGSWAHPSDLSDNISPDGSSAYNPRVAMDDAGSSIIVWNQRVGNHHQIFKSECRSGSWTHPSGPADHISPDGNEAGGAVVEMTDAGDSIIVWVQKGGYYYADPFQVFVAEYRSGAWSFPSDLLDNISPDLTSVGSSQVAMYGAGNSIITWSQPDAAYLATARIFRSESHDGSWTHPSGLTDGFSPDGGDAGVPRVACNARGRAVIAWIQTDGSNTRVFKSDFR